MEFSVYVLNCLKLYLKYLVIMFINGFVVYSRNGKYMVFSNVYYDSMCM